MAAVAFRNSIWELLGTYALIAALKRFRGRSPAKSVLAESMADRPLRDPEVASPAKSSMATYFSPARPKYVTTAKAPIFVNAYAAR